MTEFKELLWMIPALRHVVMHLCTGARKSVVLGNANVMRMALGRVSLSGGLCTQKTGLAVLILGDLSSSLLFVALGIISFDATVLSFALHLTI